MPKQTIHSSVKGVSTLSPDQYALNPRIPYDSLYVIGDVHGCAVPFIHLLNDFKPHDNQLLILNGDLINKGPDTFEVLMHVYRLKTKYPDHVYILLGNHENLFLKFLMHPNETYDLFYKAGGIETLRSFGYDTDMQAPDSIAYDTKTTYHEFVTLLREASLYFEDHHDDGVNIITHAGVNLKDMNLKQAHPLEHIDYTQPLDYLTIRDDFHMQPIHDSRVRFFVGHTPTQFLHDKHTSCKNSIFTNDNHTIVAMDGNIHRDGQLHAVTVKGSHYTTNTFVCL